MLISPTLISRRDPSLCSAIVFLDASLASSIGNTKHKEARTKYL